MNYTDAIAADEGIAALSFAATGSDLAVPAVPSTLLAVEERVAYTCGTAM